MPILAHRFGRFTQNTYTKFVFCHKNFGKYFNMLYNDKNNF